MKAVRSAKVYRTARPIKTKGSAPDCRASRRVRGQSAVAAHASASV
jgi:hypothetical protein